MGAKHNKCCCGNCLLAEDDFNRADGPVGGRWYGSGTIVSGVLHADHDHTTVCHPSYAPLGSLWSYATMVDCDPSRSYVVKVGDPTGDYTITVTFSGTIGISTGIMTITVDSGTDSATYDYSWEHADEKLTVCYAPGVQLSAGPTSRSGEQPDWVTVCIPTDPHDTCWDLGGTDVGNWEFVSGYWDDWRMEIFESEKEICNACDCYCLENDVKSCVPDTLWLTITGGCVAGSYEMKQRRVVGTSTTAPPTVELWPQKYDWITDPIICGSTTIDEMAFVVMVRCQKEKGSSYPKWLATVLRWGTRITCSNLGFDATDPDTLVPSTAIRLDSQANTKSGSTCDPVSLELPDLVEDGYSCSPGGGACCGGGLVSGGGGGGGSIDPPVVMTMVITE